MTPLRQRMIEDMRLRNLSPNTIDAYVHAVAQFARHYGRSPGQLDGAQARQYLLHLLHLVQAQHASWSRYNQARCGLQFLYRVMLKQEERFERLPCARAPKRLPMILCADELRRLFDVVAYHPKHKALLLTLYGAGLRIPVMFPGRPLRPVHTTPRTCAIVLTNADNDFANRSKGPKNARNKMAATKDCCKSFCAPLHTSAHNWSRGAVFAAIYNRAHPRGPTVRRMAAARYFLGLLQVLSGAIVGGVLVFIVTSGVLVCRPTSTANPPAEMLLKRRSDPAFRAGLEEAERELERDIAATQPTTRPLP